MSENPVYIIPIGTRVKIGPGKDIEAQITAISIRSQLLTYECVWWEDRIRRVEWLTIAEIALPEGMCLKQIGFMR